MNLLDSRESRFLGAFIVGSLFIVVVRSYFTGIAAGLVVAVFCASIIVGLAIWAYQESKDKARIRQTADDYYYLGLLFTLISLIQSLVSIFLLEDKSSEYPTQRLIGNFGIALITTVVGIVTRVVLLGLQDQEGERTERTKKPEREVQTPINQYDINVDIRDLRFQIREATEAFSHFTRITLSQATDTKAHTERLMREFTDRVDKMARERLELLDEVTNKWKQSGEEIKEQIGETHSSVSQLIADVYSKSESASSKLLAQAETATEVSQRSLNSALELMKLFETELTRTKTQLTETMTSFGQSSDLITQFTKQLSTATQSNFEFARSVDSNRDALKELAPTLEALNSAQQASSGSMSEISGTLARIQELTRASENAAEMLQASLKAAVESKAQLDSLEASAKDSIQSKAEEFVTTVDDLKKVFSQQTNSLSEATKSLTESTKILNQTATEWLEQLQKLKQRPRWFSLPGKRN